MPRAPTTFRQRDVAAAIKAARAAGCIVARVEVGKDGRIILILTGKEQPDNKTEANEWDNVT
jgi:hypothetical protein